MWVHVNLHGFLYAALCRRDGGYPTAAYLFRLHARRNPACIAPFHAVVDVGVFGGDFGAALAQGFLYDAQILGLLVEVCAAAVAEEMAGVAGLFEPRCGEGAVDDVADADARDASLRVVGGAGDDGRGEPILRRDGAALLDVCLEEFHRFFAGVDEPRVPFAAYLDAAALPVDVLVGEAHDLDDAQSLDAHKVDDEEVAETFEVVFVLLEVGADLADLVDGQVFVVLVEMLRVAQLEVGAGVLGDEGKPLGDFVKGTDGGAFDHEGRGAVIAAAHFLHVDADLIVADVIQGMQSLCYAPAEEQADREFVGVARVLGRRAARDVARQILIEMRDEIFGRDGILPDAEGRGVHGAYISDGRTCRRAGGGDEGVLYGAVCCSRFLCHDVMHSANARRIYLVRRAGCRAFPSLFRASIQPLQSSCVGRIYVLHLFLHFSFFESQRSKPYILPSFLLLI